MDQTIKLEIYEPAMCCASGVCGPSVDPELLRISSIVHARNHNHTQIARYNLKDHPMRFVQNPLVQKLLKEKGVAVLPLTLVGNTVLTEGSYPTNAQIEEALGLQSGQLKSDIQSIRPQKPKVKLSDLKVQPGNLKQKSLDQGGTRD